MSQRTDIFSQLKNFGVIALRVPMLYIKPHISSSLEVYSTRLKILSEWIEQPSQDHTVVGPSGIVWICSLRFWHRTIYETLLTFCIQSYKNWPTPDVVVVDTRFCTHDLIKENDHSYTPKIMIALHVLICSLHIIKMILRF